MCSHNDNMVSQALERALRFPLAGFAGATGVFAFRKSGLKWAAQSKPRTSTPAFDSDRAADSACILWRPLRAPISEGEKVPLNLTTLNASAINCAASFVMRAV